MTAPTSEPGLWIAFANPVEVFPVDPDNTIHFQDSYKAVCHQLTVDGLSLLQVETAAPARLVIGVHCEGRIFFLPGNRVDFRQVGAGVFALQAQFTTPFDPKGRPPKITFIPEAEVESWLRDVQLRRVPDQEKRQHPRTAYSDPIEVSDAPVDFPAFALNRSAGGIALITTYPLKPEEVRLLRLPQPDGTTVQTKTRIVYCNPIMPPFYHVGGQFLPA